jgi:hypothetical protein
VRQQSGFIDLKPRGDSQCKRNSSHWQSPAWPRALLLPRPTSPCTVSPTPAMSIARATPAALNGTNKFSGIQSGLLSGSRLGFKGEEALGNGLKAVFTLEYSLNIDNNSGVGSTGRPECPPAVRRSCRQLRYRSPSVVSMLRATGHGQQRPGWRRPFRTAVVPDAQAGNTITPNSAARWDNALTYTSPNWGGFTGKAIYSFGENSSCTRGAPRPAAVTVSHAQRQLRIDHR